MNSQQSRDNGVLHAEQDDKCIKIDDVKNLQQNHQQGIKTKDRFFQQTGKHSFMKSICISLQDIKEQNKKGLTPDERKKLIQNLRVISYINQERQLKKSRNQEIYLLQLLKHILRITLRKEIFLSRNS